MYNYFFYLTFVLFTKQPKNHYTLFVLWHVRLVETYRNTELDPSFCWTLNVILICPRWRCSWVWSGGGFPDATDALAEDGQRRVSTRVFGPRAYSSRLGGTLSLQKGERWKAKQKEGKGQEEQEEMMTRSHNYLNKVL